MTRHCRYDPGYGRTLWVLCLTLVCSGLFGLANAHAFNIQVTALTGPAPTAFTYLINEDNTGKPSDPNPMQHPSMAPMPSHSPIVAAGRETTASGISLPDGRYLISVRADGYKLWGRHIRIAGSTVFDADGTNLGGTVTIALRPAPLPLSSLQIQVFEDYNIPNGFPDYPNEINATGSVTNMPGFHIVLSDGTGQVVVDWEGKPICGTGKCLTNARGRVTIPGLVHGKYEITAIPPSGSTWIQTTTFEGTKQVDAWLEESSDGLGAPGELLGEPGVQTAFIFGFVHPTSRNTLAGGSGTITGTVKNLTPFPPFEQLTFGEPVTRPWIVVTNLASDTQVKVVRGNANGTFSISAPPGQYQLLIFDEFLHYIMAFYTVQIPAAGGTVSPGFDPACTTPNVNCSVGIFRWFGWLSGYVFLDTNLDSKKQSSERGIANIEVRGAFRDGSHYKGTVTNSSGFYELPTFRGPLGKMFNAEVGFTNFGITGHSAHREQFAIKNQRDPSPIVVDQGVGGGLILSQAVWEGRRSIVDWGKIPYTGTNNGGISGRVLYAITRNEFDARLQAAEDYEPGIPNVTVQIWGLGPNGQVGGGDDVLLNELQTDLWQMPRMDNPDNQVSCDVLDKNANPLPGATPELMAENCLEVPAVGNETKPGAYDGGWAFGDICPPATGYPCAESALISPIPPAQYVIRVIPPEFYQVVKEEDNNTAEGNALIPTLPPPPCVGDSHTVPDMPDYVSPFEGQPMPLCDRRLVTLQARQNPGLDIFLFTTDEAYVTNDPNSSWTSTQAVPPPGRFFGLVEDDINLNLNVNSITYGEKRGVPGLPIGVYEYGEGGKAVSRRLLTVFTDENGFYEVLLPSTTTTATPIPGGVSPAMYVLVVNDPGEPARPNPGFSKAYLTEPAVRDIWPGKMTPADTPVDPINALVCGVPPDAPQIFHVDKPRVFAASATNITITGTAFGNTSTPPTVTLDDNDGVNDAVTLTVVTWTPAAPPGTPHEDVVVVTVPASFPAGPAQLQVTSGPITGGPGGLKPSRNGLTIHVTGTNPTGNTYNPTVVNVFPPAIPGTPAIQPAINGASADSLIVVAPGTYHENVILHKKVKLQGHGPGGAVGAANVDGEEPFSHIPGTVIDGRFFHFVGDKRTAWQATLTASGAFGGPPTVPAGAGITVVAGTTEFSPPSPAPPDGVLPAKTAPQIDGFGITASRGEGGGGIYVHAYGRNLIISNNIIESNQSTHGGGISLGQPIAKIQERGPTIPVATAADNQNDNIHMHHNRILDNGGVAFAGAVGIFGGANKYRFENNDVCGGFALEYGGCFSHWGKSPDANIKDNQFYFCDAVDEGGGLLIAGDSGATANGLGAGSGPVNIERNLIQANLSNDDGGGIQLLRPLADRINIINNIIVNNVATDHGGGIAVDDASNVVIVNNTIADNVSTHTATDAMLGQAHGAGITVGLHSTQFMATGQPRFTSPVLFNNIIFGNLAYRWALIPDTDGEPGMGLVPTAFIDLEVFGGTLATDCLTVSYSFLSGPYLSPTGAPCPLGPGNIVANGGLPPELPAPTPLFVDPLPADLLEISVAPGRFNPAVLTPFLDRPEMTLVGFTNYHLLAGSQAINTGTPGPVSGVTPPTNDIDGDRRPQPQPAGAYDKGADEVCSPPMLHCP